MMIACRVAVAGLLTLLVSQPLLDVHPQATAGAIVAQTSVHGVHASQRLTEDADALDSAWRGTTNVVTGGAGWGNLARELFSTETVRTSLQATKGAATAIGETVTGIAQTVSMLTSSEGRAQLADSMRAIYHDAGGGTGGFLAVVNQFNPAYHALEAGSGYVEALRQGDYEEAGRHGLHLSIASLETAAAPVAALAAPAHARAFAGRVGAIGSKAHEFLAPRIQALGQRIRATGQRLLTDEVGAISFGGRRAQPTAGFFGRSLDELSTAAGVPGKSDFTVAGHALTKHAAGQRAGSRAFPGLRGGPAEINDLAQFQVDDILTYPGSRFVQRTHPTFGDTLEVIAPDGRGARFGSDGRFIGFLEPPR